MKSFLILAICYAFSNISFAQEHTAYGDQFDANEVINISQAIDVLQKTKEASVSDTKISGTITGTCAKKGCWMTITGTDQEEIRVTFKDYGFFVPTSGVEGSEVIALGTLKKTSTDVASLKHYAEDAGKSKEEIEAITAPKIEYTFVASGVQIMKK